MAEVREGDRVLEIAAGTAGARLAFTYCVHRLIAALGALVKTAISSSIRPSETLKLAFRPGAVIKRMQVFAKRRWSPCGRCQFGFDESHCFGTKFSGEFHQLLSLIGIAGYLRYSFVRLSVVG
jgi:hypothetical protein